MLRVVSLLCVFVGVLGVQSVRGDEPKTVDEVIARYIEATGGRKAMDAVKSVRATGKFVMFGGAMEAPMTLETKRPNKVRIEFTFQGMTGVRAFDGKIGWSITPFAGKLDPEKMASEEREMMEEQADMDGPLVDYRKKGHKVELIGHDEVDGADVFKLKVTRQSGSVEYHFLDAEYFLLIQVKGKRKMQGTEIEYVISFSDYKEVGGLLIPHSIEQGGFGGGGNTMTFEKIEINADVPDDRFTMPEVKKEETASETKPDAESKKGGDGGS